MLMRLDRWNHSKLLRSTAAAQCTYCGTPIEWFDRYDRQGIPLMPEVPSRLVPQRFQWYVTGGVAYPGLDPHASGYCRIPHPAVCPALDHEDLPDALAAVVATLAVRMRVRIEREGFLPALPPQQEDEISEPSPPELPEDDSTRHIIKYSEVLRLAPGRIEDLRCIAREYNTSHRCAAGVFSVEQGHWEQIDLPHVPGRTGQLVLTQTGGLMWVWSLEGQEWSVVQRWLNQRCPAHAASPTPDWGPREWAPFHPLRHCDFIIAERPEGYDPPPPPAGGLTIHDGPRPSQQCAADGCFNATVTLAPDGWLCWKCTRASKRRARTHHRWQHKPPP